MQSSRRQQIIPAILAVIYLSSACSSPEPKSTPDAPSVEVAAEKTSTPTDEILSRNAEEAQQSHLFSAQLNYGKRDLINKRVEFFEDETICTDLRFPDESWGILFFFEEGSANLNDVHGNSRLERCIRTAEVYDEYTISRPAPDLPDHRTRPIDNFERCLAPEVTPGHIDLPTWHGYAWPTEVSDEEEAQQLSQERLKKVGDVMETLQLDEHEESLPHGTTKTNFEPQQSDWELSFRDEANEVFGAYVHLYDETRTNPKSRRQAGPALSEAQYERLAEVVENDTDLEVSTWISTPGTLHLTSRPDVVGNFGQFVPTDELAHSQLDEITVAPFPGSGETERTADWLRDIVRNDCDPGAVTPLHERE